MLSVSHPLISAQYRMRRAPFRRATGACDRVVKHHANAATREEHQHPATSSGCISHLKTAFSCQIFGMPTTACRTAAGASFRARHKSCGPSRTPVGSNAIGPKPPVEHHDNRFTAHKLHTSFELKGRHLRQQHNARFFWGMVPTVSSLEDQSYKCCRKALAVT